MAEGDIMGAREAQAKFSSIRSSGQRIVPSDPPRGYPVLRPRLRDATFVRAAYP